MPDPAKLDLSERDICTKYLTPAIEQAGWLQSQFREEVKLTDGRVMVRGNVATRIKDSEVKGGPKRADYVFYAQPNVALAVLEAKRNRFGVGKGMPQALDYAEMLDAPFAISSNGDGFLLHDRTGLTQPVERPLALTEFPTYDQLWNLYQQWKSLSQPEQIDLVSQPYFNDGSGREPRYYQRVATNRAIEEIAKGEQRLLLVMATGTGKTYTAFQIIWRLWKAKRKRRILFLADRNILVDQTIQQDFAPFGEHMHKITNREVKKNYEIYLCLYQAVTGKEEWKQIYRQFPADFFDLVVVDECHRGSADEDSAWHEVLDYFKSATHLGLTATPTETKDVSNYSYFGEPIFTYSLKQGIEDGFLAPYKVIRVVSDVDALGYTPEAGKLDKSGQIVEQRAYNTKDYDRNLVLDQRTQLVARRVWEYLSATDPMAKTIVFCDDQDHAERMRQELVKLIPEAADNRRYVMRITGDDTDGKAQLGNFIDNDEPFPVIVTTSRLLSTGVDAKTCKLIVLDQNINSMTQFKQIIGRGTRIREDYQKLYFTIMDFKGATRLFADPKFDGEPVVIYEPKPDEPVIPPDAGLGPDVFHDGPGPDSGGDGTLFGEGVKGKVKELLLRECQLHTIIRLPNGVFNPYTGIKTNLLFFTKGKPTDTIWFYEHQYPAGVKSYSKTKPLRLEELQPIADWWGQESDGFAARQETEQAWKIDFKKLKAEAEAKAKPYREKAKELGKKANRLGDQVSVLQDAQRFEEDGKTRQKLEIEINAIYQQIDDLRKLAKEQELIGERYIRSIYNLDVKNPNRPEEEVHDPDILLNKYQKILADIAITELQLKTELSAALAHHFETEAA